MKMWFTWFIAHLIKTGMLFMVNDGNEDKALLVDPASYQLENSVNVYFTDPQRLGERMGAWFISPVEPGLQVCSKDSCKDNIFKSAELRREDTVFLLLHGNAKNRGAVHRIAAYKTFQSLGFYTLTIDYRGYGDSTYSGEMSETSLVQDARTAIRELRAQLGSEFKLILYGHSMGTGISAHVAALAQDEGLSVDGVILDSPFHSFAWVFNRPQWTSSQWTSYLGGILSSIMEEHDIFFNSVHWLKQIRVPVRILHAEVDTVAPIEGSEQLLEDAKLSGKQNIDLVRFDEEGLGHIGISRTKGFKHQIQDFARLVRAL